MMNLFYNYRFSTKQGEGRFKLSGVKNETFRGPLVFLPSKGTPRHNTPFEILLSYLLQEAPWFELPKLLASSQL